MLSPTQRRTLLLWRHGAALQQAVNQQALSWLLAAGKAQRGLSPAPAPDSMSGLAPGGQSG